MRAFYFVRENGRAPLSNNEPMNKSNYLYKFQKDKEYQKLLKEEKELLDITLQIIEARKKRKLTQHQFAKKVGMPLSQIAKIERGCHNVTFSTLSRVTRGLGLHLKAVA